MLSPCPRCKRTSKIPGEVVRPVDVARLMTEHGVSLRRAHGFLQSLVQGDVVAVQMVAPRVEELVTRFAALAVEALELRLPEVSTKAVRARLNLSQSEFALRFGFELDTVQNWDQGRNQPDGAAKILLAIIDRDPAIVDAVLSGQRSPGQTS